MASTDAEENYLRAGERVLAAMSNPLKQLTIEAVIQAAGRTPQSFKEYLGRRGRGGWAGYKRALVRHITTPTTHAEVNDILDLLRKAVTDPEPIEALRAFCKQDFQLVRDQPLTGTLLGLVGGTPERETADAVGRLYREFDDLLVPLLEQLLQALGRKPVTGLTTTDLTVIFNSLVDGMTLRARVDHRPTADLYTTAVLSLLGSLTVPRDSQQGLAERIESAFEC